MRHVSSMPLLGLPVFDELTDREADVSCDLAEQDGRNVSALVKGHGCTPARIVSILLMRATLPDLTEPELEQNCHNFRRLENRDIAHESSNSDVVDSDELGLKVRFTILQKHANNFPKIAIEFVERFPLRVSTGKARDKTDEQPRTWIALNYRSVALHGISRGVGESSLSGAPIEGAT